MLSTLILQLYGSCDYLDKSGTFEMRTELNQTLMSQALSVSEGTLQALKPMLIFAPEQPDFDTLARQIQMPDFLSPLPVLKDDFVWLDHEMALHDPKMKSYNISLFNQALDEIKELKPRNQDPSVNQPASDLNQKESSSPSKGVKEESVPASSERFSSGQLDQAMSELKSLIGLDPVKKDIEQLVNMARMSAIRKAHGLKAPAISRHLVFEGNPGTGKTTVARLLGKIYHALHLLSKGQLVETDRSTLVAGYIGQTAKQTLEQVKKAMGGVLFIDEAYALSKQSPNDFGQEAIETLLKAMEDNREDLVVIVAGYTEPMEKFLDSNPGFRSRFTTTLHFDDYTPEQMLEIARLMAKESDYRLSEGACSRLLSIFEEWHVNPPKGFANGRSVRQLMEKGMIAQAARLLAGWNGTNDEEELDMETESLELMEASDFE